MSDSTLKETLFAGSTVRLFGHKFEGLLLATEDEERTLKGAPPILRALQEQLKYRNKDGDLKPGLARIYGFSYLGNYYKLSQPAVLLVFGEGEAVREPLQDEALRLVGVEFMNETFTPGVRMWAQDQADYTVRIDISAGWLADVLLEPEMSDGTNMTTGQTPATGGRGPFVGRAAMVGRAALVGRAAMVGRNNSGS
jgi:hypothetical protein